MSAGWASPPSRGLCGGDALLLSVSSLETGTQAPLTQWCWQGWGTRVYSFVVDTNDAAEEDVEAPRKKSKRTAESRAEQAHAAAKKTRVVMHEELVA